jgi:hypothetical protein
MTKILRTKRFAGRIELNAAQGTVGKEGAFRATLARLATTDGTRVVDRDGDAYTGPQAWPVGKAIVISAYGHTSWQGALPVGFGVVGANQHTAWVSGEFFTDTNHGRDTYNTVKQLAAKGLGDWSYGYDALDYSNDPSEIRAFAPGAKRILKQLDVYEASPVLVGAGVGTGTDSIKDVDPERAYRAFVDHLVSMISIDPRYARVAARLIGG